MRCSALLFQSPRLVAALDELGSLVATSHVMQKYRVNVHGQNLLTEVDVVRQRLGLYTNVFIEAFQFTRAVHDRALGDAARDAGYENETRSDFLYSDAGLVGPSAGTPNQSGPSQTGLAFPSP